MMHVYGELSGRLTAGERISGRLAAEERIRGSLTIPSRILPEEYEGSYDVTPGPEEQILATANRWLTEDITVQPIPDNYGLITWDGSIITVS